MPGLVLPVAGPSPELVAAWREGQEPRVYAITLIGRDRATGDSVPLYVTDAEVLRSSADDSPAHADFAPILRSGWRLTERLADDRALTGLGLTTHGTLQLSDQRGALRNHLRQVELRGGTVQVLVGAKRRVDGSRLPLAQWWDLLPSTLGRILRAETAGREISIRLDDRGDSPLAASDRGRPVVIEAYGGTGWGVRFDGVGVATAAPVSGLWPLAGGSGYALGLSCTIHNLFARTTLVRHGSGGAWCVLLDVELDGRPTLTVGSFADRVTATDPLPIDEPLGVVVRVRPDTSGGLVSLGIRRADGELSWPILDHPMPWLPAADSAPLELNIGGAAWSVHDLWGLTAAVEPPEDPLIDDALRTRLATSPIDSEGLVWHYRMEDREGDPSDELGGPDIVLTAGTWTSALDGADPSRFGGSIASEPRSRVIGPCRQVPGRLVDPSTPWWRFSDRPLDRIDAVRGNDGAPIPEGDPDAGEWSLHADGLAVASITTDVPGPTADVVGLPWPGADPIEDCQASAQLAHWTGRQAADVVSLLAFDPVLGIASGAQPPSEADVVARIARAICGPVIRLQDGRLLLAHWPVPDDDIDAAAAVELPERRLSDPLDDIPAAWSLRVGYAPLQTVLDAVPEVVPADEAAWLTRPMRWVDDVRPELRERHPGAIALDLPTDLDSRADALECLRRWRALRGRPLRLERHYTHGLDAIQLRPGALYRMAGSTDVWVCHTKSADPTRDQVDIVGYRPSTP